MGRRSRRLHRASIRLARVRLAAGMKALADAMVIWQLAAACLSLCWRGKTEAWPAASAALAAATANAPQVAAPAGARPRGQEEAATARVPQAEPEKMNSR